MRNKACACIANVCHSLLQQISKRHLFSRNYYDVAQVRTSYASSVPLCTLTSRILPVSVRDFRTSSKLSYILARQPSTTEKSAGGFPQDNHLKTDITTFIKVSSLETMLVSFSTQKCVISVMLVHFMDGLLFSKTCRNYAFTPEQFHSQASLHFFGDDIFLFMCNAVFSRWKKRRLPYRPDDGVRLQASPS